MEDIANKYFTIDTRSTQASQYLRRLRFDTDGVDQSRRTRRLVIPHQESVPSFPHIGHITTLPDEVLKKAG